ncbi:MAG: hypothetical protein M0Q42_07755 [Xanthomonadales bacterium]|nr:hypothetical protein [Xanthomonadales bacterium]
MSTATAHPGPRHARRIADTSVLARRPALWLAALLLAAGALPVQAGGNICRVTPAGTDGNDGSDWAQAMNLTGALADSACTELWLAEGIYLPTDDGDLTVSFSPRPGTGIYGGFAGTETSRDQRDLASRRSVLSGDLDGDDVTDAHGITLDSSGLVGDNSHRVVLLDGSHGADTVLDGLVITAGMAVDLEQASYGGTGGAITCYGQGAGQACQATLRNLLLRGNFAALGGGLACLAIDGGNCEPTLEAIALVNNMAMIGGGMVIGTLTSQAANALALADAGIARADRGGGLARAVIDNSTFTGNQAIQEGAAIFGAGSGEVADTLLLRNVTIADNMVLADTGSVLVRLDINVALVNSIVWGNFPGQFHPIEPGLILRDSIVQGGCPVDTDCTGVLTGDPQLAPLLEAAAIAQVHLPGLAGSAIDSGDCDQASAQDQRGVARPAGPGCDIGAVELRQAAVQVQVAGNGRVSALPTATPLSGLIADCRHDSGDCLAFYPTETDAPTLTLRLWPDAGMLASASGCAGKLGGTYFTTAALAGDCTISVTFAAQQWPLGGTVTGQLGAGLVLQLNDDELLPVAGDGPFQFDTVLASGAPYAVDIAQQPTQPDQACQVINGSGTVGDGAVDNIVIHCGAALVHTVGGTLSGLAQSGTVALQLNGGPPQELAGNGPFVFPDLFTTGDGYLITVATQPAGQHCTVSAGEGVVGQADVEDVQVDCAAGGAQLQIKLSDDGDYASYGSVRDYRVTLANTGNGPAQDVPVTASFDPAFDTAAVTWDCLSAAPGTACTPSGSGGFSASASLAPGSSVVWLLRVPVRADSTAAQASLQVHADGAGSASDTNTLVIFRDGLDVPYGERGTPLSAGKHGAATDTTDATGRPDATGTQIQHGSAEHAAQGVAAGVDALAAASASGRQAPATATDQALRGTAATPVPATGTAALVLMLLAMWLLARRRLASRA